MARHRHPTYEERAALYAAIQEQYSQQLYHFCRVCYPDDKYRCDSLYSDLFYHIWKGLATFRHESTLSTWLYRVARNTARNDRFRQRHTLTFRRLEAGDLDIADTTDTDPQLDELYSLIRRLDFDDRHLVYLYLQQLPQHEIARILDISTTNVSTRINRIKKKLKKMHDETQ